MKNKIIAIIYLLCIVFSLPACNRSSNPEDSISKEEISTLSERPEGEITTEETTEEESATEEATTQDDDLDVGLYWSNTLLKASSSMWKNANKKPLYTDDVIWEPGYTNIKYIKIKNNSDFAILWNLSIQASGAIPELAEVIDVYYINPVSEAIETLEGLTNEGLLCNVIFDRKSTSGVLLPAAETDGEYPAGEVILAIALHMREDASNKYQNLSLGDDVTVSLITTQFYPDNDAFGDDHGNDGSTTEDSTAEEPATEETSDEETSADEATTEETSDEETSAEETTTEETTTETESTPTAKRTHFTDSLSTNGPMTDWCLPSTGTPKVLVIPVNLDPLKATNDLLSYIDIAFNGSQAQTGWYSVAEYYYISSYGKLELDFVVLDEWFTPDYSASFYDTYYDEESGYYGSTLILDEALAYYDDIIDFSEFDSNNDEIIDAIWLIYNYNVNYDDESSDFWAYVYQTPSEVEVDGVYASYYAFAGTDFMFETDVDYPNDDIIIDAHTYVHETGHLMGLDDYYDYDPEIGAEGGFYWADMMDANIGDHSSINKLLLGWIDPIIVSGEGTINIDLNSFTETGDVLLIANHDVTSIYDEYILIEFYTPTLLNENDMPIYPNYYDDEVYGIRVLHIDAHVFINEFGKIDFNNGESYSTGFLYDNSDEDKLFADTLYCELYEEYATIDILFTPDSASFSDKYGSYKYHDGTSLGFSFTVNSMTKTKANLTITLK